MFNEYSLISLLAALTSFFIGNFIYFRNPENSLNRVIAIFSVMVSFMAITEFAYRLVENPESALFWLKVSTLWPLIPAIMLQIALIFTNRGHILKNKFAYPLIYGPALIFILFGFTTDLLIGPPILEYWGWTYSIPENPIIYYLFSAWTVIISLSASILVFSYYFKAEGMDKKQALYLALGLFTPLILSLITDFIFIELSIPLPEFTQTMLTLGLIFIVYGIWRYNFPLLTPTLAAEKIISTMPNFLLLLDRKGRISKINKSIISQLGYSEKELLKESIYDIFTLENKPQLEKAIKNGESFNGECTIISNSGKAVEVLINLAPIYSIIKEPTGFVIIGTDITQRKKALQEILESELKFRSVIEQTSDGVALANHRGEIIYWNRALENITGYSKEKVTDRYLYEILYKMMTPENKELISEEKIQKIFKKAFASSKIPNKLHVEEKVIMRADGDFRDTQVTNFFLEKTNPSLFCTVVRDISDKKKAENILKNSLKEKEVMLREIHHRVKNNLQIISSLLNLQTNYVKDEEARDLFKESQNRVKSMSMIHESLYQSRDLAQVDFSIYISRLSSELFSSYGVNFNQIRLETSVEKINLDINTAIPCGLIINELLSNAIKYAFPHQEGVIKINFLQKEDLYVLEVSDNGVGLPDDIDFTGTNTLGLRLVSSLVDQLDGTIHMDKTKGTSFIMEFPELEYEPRL
ncbi:MAG: hypothetical protein CIT03_07900 [Methanobacterium sp.]|nr:MAG: hypothetical protein CIT03_07900 [Methanobacterium sp.]